MYEDPAEAVSSRRATIDVSSQVHLEAVLSNNPFEGADRPHPLPPPPGLSGSPRLRNDKVGIVVTHPHPMLGGNMHNNVVVALFERYPPPPNQTTKSWLQSWALFYLDSHGKAFAWCGSTFEAPAAPLGARLGEVPHGARAARSLPHSFVTVASPPRPQKKEAVKERTRWLSADSCNPSVAWRQCT